MKVYWWRKKTDTFRVVEIERFDVAYARITEGVSELRYTRWGCYAADWAMLCNSRRVILQEELRAMEVKRDNAARKCRFLTQLLTGVPYEEQGPMQ